MTKETRQEIECIIESEDIVIEGETEELAGLIDSLVAQN